MRTLFWMCMATVLSPTSLARGSRLLCRCLLLAVLLAAVRRPVLQLECELERARVGWFEVLVRLNFAGRIRDRVEVGHELAALQVAVERREFVELARLGVALH